MIFYFWSFLRAFWGLFFIFSGVLKQILVGGFVECIFPLLDLPVGFMAWIEGFFF